MENYLEKCRRQLSRDLTAFRVYSYFPDWFYEEENTEER